MAGVNGPPKIITVSTRHPWSGDCFVRAETSRRRQGNNLGQVSTISAGGANIARKHKGISLAQRPIDELSVKQGVRNGRGMAMPGSSGPGSRLFSWFGAIVTLLAILAGTAACSSSSASTSDEGPRPLTGAQAERLAMFQFNAYQAGMLAVTGTVVADQSVTINGWVDTSKGHGYALVQAPEAKHPGAFLAEWTASEISAQDFTGSKAPLPPPDSGWQSTALNTKASPLAAAQALLVSLSSDRPDNAQLLVQSGAEWLGSDTIDGTKVDIMSGPVAASSKNKQSSFRYWIDDDGNLLRVQALLDGVHMSTFDFSKAPGVTF